MRINNFKKIYILFNQYYNLLNNFYTRSNKLFFHYKVIIIEYISKLISHLTVSNLLKILKLLHLTYIYNFVEFLENRYKNDRTALYPDLIKFYFVVQTLYVAGVFHKLKLIFLSLFKCSDMLKILKYIYRNCNFKNEILINLQYFLDFDLKGLDLMYFSFYKSSFIFFLIIYYKIQLIISTICYIYLNYILNPFLITIIEFIRFFNIYIVNILIIDLILKLHILHLDFLIVFMNSIYFYCVILISGIIKFLLPIINFDFHNLNFIYHFSFINLINSLKLFFENLFLNLFKPNFVIQNFYFTKFFVYLIVNFYQEIYIYYMKFMTDLLFDHLIIIKIYLKSYFVQIYNIEIFRYINNKLFGIEVDIDVDPNNRTKKFSIFSRYFHSIKIFSINLVYNIDQSFSEINDYLKEYLLNKNILFLHIYLTFIETFFSLIRYELLSFSSLLVNIYSLLANIKPGLFNIYNYIIQLIMMISTSLQIGDIGNVNLIFSKYFSQVFHYVFSKDENIFDELNLKSPKGKVHEHIFYPILDEFFPSYILEGYFEYKYYKLIYSNSEILLTKLKNSLVILDYFTILMNKVILQFFLFLGVLRDTNYIFILNFFFIILKPLVQIILFLSNSFFEIISLVIRSIFLTINKIMNSKSILEVNLIKEMGRNLYELIALRTRFLNLIKLINSSLSIYFCSEINLEYGFLHFIKNCYLLNSIPQINEIFYLKYFFTVDKIFIHTVLNIDYDLYIIFSNSNYYYELRYSNIFSKLINYFHSYIINIGNLVDFFRFKFSILIDWQVYNMSILSNLSYFIYMKLVNYISENFIIIQNLFTIYNSEVRELINNNYYLIQSFKNYFGISNFNSIFEKNIFEIICVYYVLIFLLIPALSVNLILIMLNFIFFSILIFSNLFDINIIIFISSFLLYTILFLHVMKILIMIVNIIKFFKFSLIFLMYKQVIDIEDPKVYNLFFKVHHVEFAKDIGIYALSKQSLDKETILHYNKLWWGGGHNEFRSFDWRFFPNNRQAFKKYRGKYITLNKNDFLPILLKDNYNLFFKNSKFFYNGLDYLKHIRFTLLRLDNTAYIYYLSNSFKYKLSNYMDFKCTIYTQKYEKCEITLEEKIKLSKENKFFNLIRTNIKLLIKTEKYLNFLSYLETIFKRFPFLNFIKPIFENFRILLIKKFERLRYLHIMKILVRFYNLHLSKVRIYKFEFIQNYLRKIFRFFFMIKNRESIKYMAKKDLFNVTDSNTPVSVKIKKIVTGFSIFRIFNLIKLSFISFKVKIPETIIINKLYFFSINNFIRFVPSLNFLIYFIIFSLPITIIFTLKLVKILSIYPLEYIKNNLFFVLYFLSIFIMFIIIIIFPV